MSYNKSMGSTAMGSDSVFMDGNSEKQTVLFQANNCTIHPNKVLDLYCKTCQQPACSDCVTGRHSNCNTNLCSFQDAMEARRRVVARHKETMLKELKKISQTRNEMMSNVGMQQDVYSVIRSEVMKCEEDAIKAIQTETRKILDGLNRVCSSQQSLESMLFCVATIVDGSMNMLNATDSLLQLSDNTYKPQSGTNKPSTSQQRSDYDEHSSKDRHSQVCAAASVNMSPPVHDNLTNDVMSPLEDNYSTEDDEASPCFHQSDADTFPRSRHFKEERKNFHKQLRYTTDPSHTKHDDTKMEIKKPIPILKSVGPTMERNKQARQPVKSDSFIKTCPIKYSDHSQRVSAFSTVNHQIMNGDRNTGMSSHHLEVPSSGSQPIVKSTLNKSVVLSKPEVRFSTRSPVSPRIAYNMRQSPSDVVSKLRGKSFTGRTDAHMNTEPGLTGRTDAHMNTEPGFTGRTDAHMNTEPGLADDSGWNCNNFRLTPHRLSDRVEIKTQLLPKPKLIKTLQLPLENKFFHSSSASKVLKKSERPSSTESPTLIGMLERPPADVTLQPHQLDIAVVEPDESIVVADGWNSCLIAFAKDGDHYFPSVMELSFDPCCLAEVGDNTVAVTGGTDITFIKVKPDLFVEKTLFTQKYYQGITHLVRGRIAVSYTPNGIGERNVHIDILSLKGDLLQTIETEIDPDVYNTRLCCNYKQDLILACCSFGGTVSFLQKANNYAVKFQIDFTKPWSVALDAHAHIYIVDGDKDHRRLVRTSQDGSQPEEILSAENGCTIPASVVFGQDGFMYITQCDGSINIFQVAE